MKVLVTGASGFVGQWLVRRLIKENIEVRVLRRKSSFPSRHSINEPEIVLGDITDPASVIRAAQNVDSVFHLAGHVGYSRAERILMEKINVGGTQHVLDACRQNRVRRLVHMSSVAAVGASFDGRQPLHEESVFNIHHLNLGYFETKLAAEKLVKSAVKAETVDAVIVNPSTIYGAGDAAKGSRKVQLKVARGGFKFYTSGGVSIVGVEEVVDGVISAWRKGRCGERYILSGENITIHQLFTWIAELAKVPPPGLYLPNYAVRAIGLVGDAMERMGKKGPLSSENAWTSILFHWFDNQKARAELGFRPKSAREALANSVGWMREQGLLNG